MQTCLVRCLMKCCCLNSERGFTLLEVMIAVAVMGIALVTLLGSQSQSIAIATEARFETVAALLARQKMAEIRLSEYEEVTSSSGQFAGEFDQYSWQTEVEPITENETGIAEAGDMLKTVMLTVGMAVEEGTSFSVKTVLFKQVTADEVTK